MKNILIIAGLMLFSLGSTAQSDVTAWMLSSSEFGGTSRYNAMGGAFAALGGDVSVLSHNPAGIGLFRRSELSITPAFQINSVTSDYLSNSSEDIKGNFNLNNLAFVSTKTLDDDEWRNVQIGVSYNRLKDFHSNESYGGVTDGGTFADQIASSATGFPSENFFDIDPLYIDPAWQTYVIDPDVNEDETYVSAFSGNDIKQSYSKETTGRIGETAITLGGNYMDRLYLGATIGIQRINIESRSNFSEAADYDLSGVEISNYRIIEESNTTGSGINFNLGLIYRITDNVRAGFAYHSPNFMSLTQNVNAAFKSNYSDGESFSETSATIISEFNVNSPTRLVGGLAFIFGKNGVIDVDYEYVNYKKMKVTPGEFSAADFSDVNRDIESNYQSTGNVRAGAEWRLKPFSLRVGTAYYQNPNTTGSSLYANDRLIYTAGTGYKRNSMYIDFAYRLRMLEESSYLYDPQNSELVTQTYNGNSVSITMGVRF